MKRHSSDRHFQRQLEHHLTPVDAEELWANIEPVVQPKKQSRRWLFIWLLFGALGVASIWLLWDKIGHAENLVDDTTIADASSDQASIITQPETNNTIQPGIELDNTLSQTSRIVDPTSPQKENSKIDNTTATDSHRPTGNSSSKKQNTRTSAKGLTTTIDKNNNVNTKDSYPAKNQPQTANTTFINDAAIERNSSQNSPQEIQREPQEVQVPNLPSLNYTLLTGPYITIPAPERSWEAMPPPLSNRNGYGPWSITARIGIGSTLQDLVSKTDSLRSYQSARELSEEQLETVSLEVGLQWASKQNWYLRSGLGYRQTTERFSYTETSSEVIQNQDGIIRIVLSSNGDTLLIERGPVTGLRTTTYNKTTYNRYRFLEIPIIGGYNFGEGPFTFGVEAGVVPQFLFQVKGDILDTDGTFMSLETVSETKLAWSLHAAFNINYDLNEQWQLQLSPVFRYQFSNLHQADYPLEISYHSLGAQLGIRYAW